MNHLENTYWIVDDIRVARDGRSRKESQTGWLPGMVGQARKAGKWSVKIVAGTVDQSRKVRKWKMVRREGRSIRQESGWEE